VSGSGISRAICKSAPRCRQKTRQHLATPVYFYNAIGTENMWTVPRRGSRTRRGNRPGDRAAILGIFKPVCLERQALRFTSLSDARLYGRVKSSLVCGERAVLLSSPCIVESDSSSPQISNARLIIPRDLSIDQQTLHLAELGESPLKILIYS